MKVTEGDAINVWERVDCNWRYNSWASARGAGHRMNEQAPPREECKVNLDINDGTAEYWHDYRAQLSKNPRLSSPLQHAGRDDVWVSHQQVFKVEGAAQKDRLLREGVEHFNVDLHITTRSGGAACTAVDPHAAGCAISHDWTRVRVEIKDRYVKSMRRVRT